MQVKGIKFEFESKPWQYNAKGGWIFVSLPKQMSREIREFYKENEEGWGRLKTTAKIGNFEWKTAIWFDTKNDTYSLPLKFEVRSKENIEIGHQVKITIWI